MLAGLHKRFPKAAIIGLDGSDKMLKRASASVHKAGIKLASKITPGYITLVQTHLPNFALPKGVADVVLFTFPNICLEEEQFKHHAGDKKIARMLGNDEEDEWAEEYMLEDKFISKHVHSLLKKNGLLFRVTYADGHRDELSEHTRHMLEFEEGSLRTAKYGAKPLLLFKFLRESYHRSKVILDVYHQTKDPADKDGGYLITTLKAI